MKPPVPLFKKKIMKLYQFLKAKSQAKSLSTQLYVICVRGKKKIGGSFLELICFIFYISLII